MGAEVAAFGHIITAIDQTILEIDDGYADIIGRERHEVVGKQALSFTYDEDVVRNQPMLTKLANAGPAFTITKRYWKGDQSIVWVRNQVSRIDNGMGEVRLCATTTVIDSPFTANLLATHHAGAKRLCDALVIGRKLFSGEIVSAPPAEMLLRLYRAELEGEILSASMLAERIELPISLIQRWIMVLRRKGLVEEGVGMHAPLRIARLAEAMLERLLCQLQRVGA